MEGSLTFVEASHVGALREFTELLRLGAARSYKANGALVRAWKNKNAEKLDLRTCALGSALLGSLLMTDRDPLSILEMDSAWAVDERFPLLRLMVSVELLPDLLTYGPASRSLQSVIIRLNDSHGWKRESIADWLDTVIAHFEAQLDVLELPVRRREVVECL